MKTYLDSTVHEVSGQQETRNLTIEANGKAFKELISGIYSDKAYAIARETMANCVDSHVQAGTPDRPFDLKVPTTFDPEYMIRDYGVSMTHDMVMTLYSTLFRSTKDDPNSDESNKFVGKFGLGSKSPFSYTDAFQLTAYLNGESRIYDIYFNGGVPQIALFATLPTEEANGIMITFPVDPKDMKDFERAIIRASEALPVPPNFIGKAINLPQRRVIKQGKRWKLLDTTATGAAEAKQGTVLYPLNFNAVVDCPPELKPLFAQTIHLEFPIGELDVVTSREALSYDAATSANIIRAFEELRDDLRSECMAKLREATTYHEFNRAFHRIKDSLADGIWEMMMLSQETFKGKRPVNEYKVKNQDVRETTIVEIEVLGEMVKHPSHKLHHRFGDLEFCNVSRYLKAQDLMFRKFKGEFNSYYKSVEFPAKVDAIYLVFEDMNVATKRYTPERMRLIRDEHSDKFRKENVALFWVRHTTDVTFAVKRIRAALGRMPVHVIHLKDVAYEPVRMSYGSGDHYVPDDFKIIRHGRIISPGADATAPARAYYVPLYKNEIDGNSGLSFSSLDEIKEMMVRIGEDDLPIVGVPKTKRSQIRKNPDWIELLPRAKEVLELSVEEDKLLALYVKQAYEPSDTMKKVCQLRALLREKLFNPLVAGTVINEMFVTHDAVSEAMSLAAKSASAPLMMLQQLGVFNTEIEQRTRAKAKEIVGAYDKACDAVKRQFPLLAFLEIPRVKEDEGKIVDLLKEKDRRYKIAPFYAWLKSCQPVRERLSSAA